jgi:hypothetical protein
MALEAGTYISDLVAANPLAADGSGQGDDHLRLIKSCLKATFPNITGAVTPTHTVLNGLDARVTAVEGLYVKKDGTVPMTGALAMGANKITGLAASTVNGDAVRFEQLALKQDTVITTRGDLIRGGAAGVTQRVALGATGQFLKSDGTDAAWGALPVADLVTSGIVELATAAETLAQSDATRAATPASLAGLIPKAAVVFTVSGGVVTIRRSVGVTSVVRNAQGKFTVTFTSAFADAFWAMHGAWENIAAASVVGSVVLEAGSRTTTTAILWTGEVQDTGSGGAATLKDPTYCSAVFYSL